MNPHSLSMTVRAVACSLSMATALVWSGAASAGPEAQAVGAEKRRVIDHWSAARRAAAQPRDLFIDAQGQGYLRAANGTLTPYGRTADSGQLRVIQVPAGKPGGGGHAGADATPPTISAMQPGDGATIGASQEFSAVITDTSGIKSVSFIIVFPSGSTQSFTPGFAGNDTWSITLSGFSNGSWGWYVIAKDNGAKGGNTATSSQASFTVDIAGGGDPGGGAYIIGNAGWNAGGVVQEAAGRLFYEMPSNSRRKRWSGYVCSGTVVDDGISGRSVILTAAHCVYDDANKAFARNVLFIPNQDATSGSGTDSNCDNDPLGCWVASFGVVDSNWSIRSFPDNVEWDYAFYVVSDSGAHGGTPAGSEALDSAVQTMAISFAAPAYNDQDPSASSADFTHALGYSYSDDPNFMYCAEDLTTESAVNWWLPSCGLSGGASGGPWVQPMNTANGDGPIISVNSWGYTTGPGMAGPHLHDSTAACVWSEALGVNFGSIPANDGDEGWIANCQ